MAKPKERQFKASKAAENEFARSLRKIARHSGHLVEAHADGARIRDSEELKKALENYSKLIDPWARRQAAKMLEKISRTNRSAFTKANKQLGKLLRTQVAQSDVGMVAAALMNEQVELIKSIPIKAALRAQKLSMAAVYEGKRADDVAKELARSGEVSEADADRIARTEVARANSSIIQARAQAVGSKQYIWRNSGDESVRDSHRVLRGKKLDGMIFDWDNPPTLDDGTRGHPGTFPNCRCYPEPYFGD